jgi:hypothetical protein
MVARGYEPFKQPLLDSGDGPVRHVLADDGQLLVDGLPLPLLGQRPATAEERQQLRLDVGCFRSPRFTLGAAIPAIRLPDLGVGPSLCVAAEDVVGDLLSLCAEAEVTNLLSDSGCCSHQPRLLLHSRLDEVLEDELNCRERAPTVGAAQFPAQSIKRLKEKMLVCLEEVELLGEIERFFARRTALRSSFPLDFVRPLGAAPALLGGEVMGRGSALKQSPFYVGQSAQRGHRLA